MNSFKKYIFPLLVLLTLFSVWGNDKALAHDHFVILEEQPWVTSKEGYQYKTIIGKNTGSISSFELVFLKFNPYKFNIKIKYFTEKYRQPEFVDKYSNLKGNQVAIINAGYFDEMGKHLGFLKINNAVIGKRVATHPIYSGIILPESENKIIHRDQFKPEKHQDAIQVGPLLIRNGKVNPGLRNTERVHYRSGMGVDDDGDFVLFITNTNYGGISWDVLLEVLKTNDFNFKKVINLDGGGSTQLYFKKDGVKTYYRGINPVPSALVIETKE